MTECPLQDIPVPRVQAAVSASVADLGWTAAGIQSSVVNPRATASVQRRAARFAKSDYRRTTSVSKLMDDLGWRTLSDRRKDARLRLCVAK